MKFKKTNRVNSRLAENLSENKINAIKKYRELTHLNESDIITESSIDDWVLTHVCNKFAIPKYDLKEILIENKSLLEDVEPTPQEEKIARDLNADISEAEDKTELEKELDDCLKKARRKKLKAGGAGGYTDANLLVVGSAGFGKSEIIKQWAQKRGLNLYKVTLSGLQPEFMVGMPGYDPNNPGQTINLPNTAFLNQLNKPNTVLFLDELNRAHARLRAPLLQLVAHHEIQAGSETVEVPNLLFTVAAINPVSSAYGGVNSMDAAEYRRFKLFKVTPNPIEHLRYLDKFYAEDYEDAKRANDEEWMKEAQGKRALANLILKDPRFEYTSLAEEEENIDRQEAGEWRSTNYASFKDALDDSDGTKDSFIKAFKNKCNPDQVKVIEDILKNYKDIDDKANQALKAGTKSKVLQKQSTLFDRINDYLSSIGEDGIDFN